MVLMRKLYNLTQHRNNGHQVLVLRDLNGRVITAYTQPDDLSRIRRWHKRKGAARQYTEHKKWLAVLRSHQRLKTRLRRKGYRYQLSLYGYHPGSALAKEGHRRIEVMAKQQYRVEDVLNVYALFKHFIPPEPSTVICYA